MTAPINVVKLGAACITAKYEGFDAHADALSQIRYS
jgi:hypothetical protein